MYFTMLKIRLVEETVADLVTRNEINCPCHLYIGQEAIATGACVALKKEDYVFSTHRSHGHFLAKGGDLKKMMAELFGKVTGCSKGNGGSMHLVAPEIGYLGSSAIVAGTVPLAIGTALSSTIQKVDKISIAFFGDGAATEGVMYESLNFASLKKLPVIFICENNFYSTHMHINEIQAGSDIYKRAESFNIPAYKIDGNNVIDVYKTTSKAVEHARCGNGPSFIECMTYRWRGHVGPNWDLDKGLRSEEEVQWWINNCGIRRIEDLLLSTKIMSLSENESLKSALSVEIDGAVRFAKESPYPDVTEYKNKVFK
jgi:pyruvate dehydrogenase E1 component alpha subunit